MLGVRVLDHLRVGGASVGDVVPDDVLLAAGGCLPLKRDLGRAHVHELHRHHLPIRDDYEPRGI